MIYIEGSFAQKHGSYDDGKRKFRYITDSMIARVPMLMLKR